MSKKTLRLLVFSAGLVWLCGWAAPAQALYAPAQNLLYAGIDPVYSNVVTYQVMDPFNPWVPAADSWTLDPSFCSDWGIDPPVVDGGIVAWVSKKMTTGETEYAYTVHYRIYDPGRGRWVGGEHELNTGAARQIYNLIVKDGVVAWKAGYRSSPSPTADKTYLVTCVTYNPIDGVWPENTYTLPVPYDSPRAPEVLSVQNGVVAWPNLPFDDNIDIHFRIYDPEIKGWVWGEDVNDWFDMEWVKIENATVHLRVGKPGLPGGYDYYRGYNIDTHQWMEDSTTTPRASFVAQPVSGLSADGAGQAGTHLHRKHQHQRRGDLQQFHQCHRLPLVQQPRRGPVPVSQLRLSP
jgi:hypothetical protein